MAKPLTIGYVFPWTVTGGGEMATVRLARAMSVGGQRAATLPPVQAVAYVAHAVGDRRSDSHGAGGARNAVADLCEANGLSVRFYQPPEFSYRHPVPFLRDSARLAGQFRRDGIDLVHGSDLMSVYHAGVAAKGLGIPLVTHIRSQFPDRLSRRRAWPIRLVDEFVFVSRATWAHFNQLWPVPPSRGRIVYDWPPSLPAASAEGHSPHGEEVHQREVIRTACGVRHGTPLITMVARISPQKDFDTLFDAFALLIERHPHTHLMLVGGDDPSPTGQQAGERWRRRAHEQFHGRVTWTGHRDDVDALLIASDIVVLASHGEGVPLVLLEAMARDRPVVATAVGGVAELVIDGQTGLLHPHGDAEGLATALQLLIEQPSRARALASAGRAHVERLFGERQAVESIGALYARQIRRRTEVGRPVAVAVP